MSLAKRQGRNRVVIAAMDDPVDIGREPPIIGDEMVAAE